MSVFRETSYKTALKNLVAERRKGARPLTLKQIAKRLRIQYTYLSRVLNDPDTHLTADRLYKFCVALGLGREETDFLIVLRDYESADDAEWSEHLLRRVEQARVSKQRDFEVQRFASSQFQTEMNYLFDPLALVVQVSLFLPAYRKEPRLLCPQLGITPARLKKILATLADVGHIELADDGVGVKRFLRTHIHYGRDHPLMRVHQSLLKTAIQSQLMRIPEEDKHSVLMTFTMDPRGFELAKAKLQKLMQELDELTKKSRDEGTYQLSMDLFRWI